MINGPFFIGIGRHDMKSTTTFAIIITLKVTYRYVMQNKFKYYHMITLYVGFFSENSHNNDNISAKHVTLVKYVKE